MKNVLLYARVSTLNQKENETIKQQLHMLKAYCKDNDLNIVDIYEDEAVSGADEERVINLVKYLQEHQNEIDGLIFTYFARLARDTFLQLWVEKECKKLDITITAIQQELFSDDTDPMTRAMRQMMSVFAELERNIITGRLKGGRKYKAQNRGIKSQGQCPLGYEYQGKTTKDKVVVVNEEEAEVVRNIFRTFLDTRSTSKTAKMMNAAGHTTKRGNTFTKQAIQVIVKNDFYTGVNKYNGRVKGEHEAIISKHLFTKASRCFSSFCS